MNNIDGLVNLEQAANAPLGPPTADNNSIPAYRGGGSPESNFCPIPACELLDRPIEEVDWVLDEILPAGGLVILAGRPKDGKTTLSYEAAVKIALGQPFLGRETKQGAVLILALEEHVRDVLLRLRNLGATTLSGLYAHTGPLEPSADVLSHITAFCLSRQVRLILVDTLSAFWKIENENDAAEMTKVVKPLLQLARDSGACVLLIHHARKSEGQYGDEIRGSGALFASVDVALVLKRHEVHTQRLLQAQSRYPETPSELVIELRECGYVALGDQATVGKAARLTKLIEILSDEWEEVGTQAKKAGISSREGRRLLDLLAKDGKAIVEGKGVKGSPRVFKRNSIPAGGGGYREYTNRNSGDSIPAGVRGVAGNESHRDPCFMCKGTKFWRSVHGAELCASCRAPVSPELVAEWIG